MDNTTNPTYFIWFLEVLSLLFWIWLGTKIEAAKWRRNADEPMRIYSAGALYKVYKDEGIQRDEDGN